MNDDVVAVAIAITSVDKHMLNYTQHNGRSPLDIVRNCTTIHMPKEDVRERREEKKNNYANRMNEAHAPHPIRLDNDATKRGAKLISTLNSTKVSK